MRDVALICHNAQVYNRPSAPIFGAAVRLREVFEGELKKLVSKDVLKAEDARLPDLGELPPADESPEPEDEEDGEEDDDEDEDEEDEENDDDDSEDQSGRRRRWGAGRRRHTTTDGRDDDDHKRRGRPPQVFTPNEARIQAVLKGLRKFKDDDDDLLILPFEKLPDKQQLPDYYEVIANPIALDMIKKKAKMKKYTKVDDVLRDLELMFSNAQLYNEDGSDIFEAAVELQKQTRLLAAQENARSDDEFRDEDGKLPLSGIEYNGQVWKVGEFTLLFHHLSLAIVPAVEMVGASPYCTGHQRREKACQVSLDQC